MSDVSKPAAAGRELVALYSPLAAALVSVLGYPVERVAGALRRRRFALLDIARDAPRVPSALMLSRVEALWPGGYERREYTGFKHW